MKRTRPEVRSLIGQDLSVVPMSLQRVAATWSGAETIWIGPEDAVKLLKEDQEAYDLSHKIMCHLCVQAPTRHASGHPGGPLSSFTFAYFLGKVRDPVVDQPLQYSAGHLSILAYGLQWLFGREGNDPRLQSPQAIIESFRTPGGLPGHIEAGIGDIPFGTGPLGKGVSHAVGAALGLKYLRSINPHSGSLPSKGERMPMVDVVLGDGDCQEGQIMEAFRLAARLGLDNLVVHGDFNDVQLSDQPSKTMAADFASIAAAAGWRVIEVQNGNDPGQVLAALNATDNPHPNLLPSKGEGRPTFICYYTTMGYGVRVMEEGSNTGKENFHGTPLKKEVAEAALKELPPLAELVKKYEPFRVKLKIKNEKLKIKNAGSVPFSVRNLKGYSRTITTEPGAVRKDFGAVHLLNLMRADPRIVVLHADLADSGGFGKVAAALRGSASGLAPQGDIPRVINVGVAEANMTMMAAGMRQVGLLPVTYTFAAFGTNEARANARLIDINCAHVPCGVLHDCTHSGVSVGEDGETHQEQNYLNIPFRNTQVWMPADSNQGAAMAERAMEIVAEGRQSVYVFSSRSNHPQIVRPDGAVFYGKEYVFGGKADMLRGNGDSTDAVTIIATGITVHAALRALDLGPRTQDLGPNIRLLNVACIRPLDTSAIIQAALETAHLIVVEDHNTEGGLATQVADIIADFQLPCSLRRLGLRQYFPSGTDKDLLLMAGLDAESIAGAVQDEVQVDVRGGEDAFVSVIHRMPTVLGQSRFGASARAYVERIAREKGYLELLREKWRKRAVDPKNLPTNEELRGVLGLPLEARHRRAEWGDRL